MKRIESADKLPFVSDLSQDQTWNSIFQKLEIGGYSIQRKENCAIACGDSRRAIKHLPDDSISCIITSPPYLGLKDYGSAEQIGFGQQREEQYLPDLEKVLSELHRVSKQGAALWMVLDMVKEDGEMVALPWDVINRARHMGWTFHDIVIWDKGKSLPWSNPGRFRGVCEFILLFGKGKLANFNLDAVRDATHLSPYWVKYPERYHPDGKAPSDLWHFPIPTQGAWGKDQSKHHCPFPIGLVAQMLSISTNKGDVVLDPFSGTGSVAAVANHLGRYGIGIELNSSFVDEFYSEGFDRLTKRAKEEFPNRKTVKGSLREIIVNLRMLKYPKSLYAGLARADLLGGNAREYIAGFLIANDSQSQEEVIKSNNLGAIDLKILLRPNADIDNVKIAISERIKVAPLSIFGIKAQVEVIPYEGWNTSSLTAMDNSQKWFLYKNGNFNKYSSEVEKEGINECINREMINPLSKSPIIISKILMKLDSTEDR